MPEFAYSALDSHGIRTTGVCRSANAQSAVAALRAGNLYVLELREAPDRTAIGPRSVIARGWSAASGAIQLCRPITRRDLIQFFQQMSLMIRAGLIILRALEVFRNQCPKPRLAGAVGRIADRILRGATLSSAFEAEKRFPPLAVKMIAAGEATGELDVVMEKIAAQMEHEAEVRNSLLTSLMYPALVVLITTGVVAFLVTKVLPKFAQLLAARNVALPPTTRFLMDAAEFLNQKGPLLAAGLLGGLLVIAAARATRRGRYVVDRVLLLIPVVSRILTLAFVAHFGRTMAILLKSGLPILIALKLMGETVGNKAFGAQLRKAEREVLKGRPMSQGLRARIIPPLLPELVTTGEATGELDTVLEELGLFYEKKLQREVRLMAALFEPLMILIVGGIVGLVYIAFFQALYQVSTGGRF